MSLWGSHREPRMKQLEESMQQQEALLESLARQVHRLGGEVTSEVKKLTRLCQAMWSLLVENTDLTEEDLKTRIDEMARRDEEEEAMGLDELKLTCPHCGAVLPHDLDKCQFCGTPL